MRLVHHDPSLDFFFSFASSFDEFLRSFVRFWNVNTICDFGAVTVINDM